MRKTWSVIISVLTPNYPGTFITDIAVAILTFASFAVMAYALALLLLLGSFLLNLPLWGRLQHVF